MRNSHILLTATLALALASVQTTLADTANNASFTRKGDMMTVDFEIDTRALNIKSNEALLITPGIISPTDSTALESVGIYGRRRYIYYIRNNGTPLSGAGERIYTSKDCPDTLKYTLAVPYGEWMDGSQLFVDYTTFGCCNKILGERREMLGNYEEFHPTFIFVQPTGANVEKIRNLSGSAFIDFPVNKTVIYPDYRNNTAELGKISSTIDSVRSDGDVTIKEVWLKGYASPESPYAHNANLARGRVAALKDHVQKLYHFADGIITTDFEAEDWEGLRHFVENSSLDHRDAILAIIDSDVDPDAKEASIKKSYPADYKFMLQNWYPALRHTDYKIEYTIRTFVEPEDIARVMAEAPQKLNLNEFFVLSNSYEPGSDEFNNVWATAVRMFPTDATANLNAASSALQRGDLTLAERYLEKAGNSAEAEYTRGILAALKENYPKAKTHLEKAAEGGMDKANEVLNKLIRLKRI